MGDDDNLTFYSKLSIHFSTEMQSSAEKSAKTRISGLIGEKQHVKEDVFCILKSFILSLVSDPLLLVNPTMDCIKPIFRVKKNITDHYFSMF